MSESLVPIWAAPCPSPRGVAGGGAGAELDVAVAEDPQAVEAVAAADVDRQGRVAGRGGLEAALLWKVAPVRKLIFPLLASITPLGVFVNQLAAAAPVPRKAAPMTRTLWPADATLIDCCTPAEPVATIALAILQLVMNPVAVPDQLMS
jgi:hypothetical protein